MSGHSKWATIHRQKEVKDGKRGAIFTKYAHAITIAARQKEDYKLRLAVEKARAVNMPKDNIQRAIDRASGSDSASLEEVIFEGFAPGGVAIIVEGLTDSRLRMTQAVREVLEKSGGTVGSHGSVSYMFNHLGEVIVKSSQKDELELSKDDWMVTCAKDKLAETKEDLEKMGYEIESMELVYLPINEVEVKDPELRERIESIISRLEDIDEVTKVWSNYA